MNRILPPTIQAGTTLDRCVPPLQDYPAPTWALNVYLRGPATLNLAADVEGAGFRLQKAAADTAQWIAGTYAYVVRVTDANGTVEQVESGQVEVLADPLAIVDGTDLRSDAEKVLESIEAVIAKRATRDQERYKINDRELWRTPMADLLKLRNVYRVEVRRQRLRAAGLSVWGPALRVRM